MQKVVALDLFQSDSSLVSVSISEYIIYCRAAMQRRCKADIPKDSLALSHITVREKRPILSWKKLEVSSLQEWHTFFSTLRSQGITCALIPSINSTYYSYSIPSDDKKTQWSSMQAKERSFKKAVAARKDQPRITVSGNGKTKSLEFVRDPSRVARYFELCKLKMGKNYVFFEKLSTTAVILPDPLFDNYLEHIWDTKSPTSLTVFAQFLTTVRSIGYDRVALSVKNSIFNKPFDRNRFYCTFLIPKDVTTGYCNQLRQRLEKLSKDRKEVTDPGMVMQCFRLSNLKNAANITLDKITETFPVDDTHLVSDDLQVSTPDSPAPSQILPLEDTRLDSSSPTPGTLDKPDSSAPPQILPLEDTTLNSSSHTPGNSDNDDFASKRLKSMNITRNNIAFDALAALPVQRSAVPVYSEEESAATALMALLNGNRR